MTQEQRARFLEDYQNELSRLYSLTANNMTENKTRADAINAFNEGSSKMITALAADKEADAKLIEANAKAEEAKARTLEAQAKAEEVKVLKKQGWIRIGVDIVKGIGAFMLVNAVYGAEKDGGWFLKCKESSKLASDQMRENLLRK